MFVSCFVLFFDSSVKKRIIVTTLRRGYLKLSVSFLHLLHSFNPQSWEKTKSVGDPHTDTLTPEASALLNSLLCTLLCLSLYLFASYYEPFQTPS